MILPFPIPEDAPGERPDPVLSQFVDQFIADSKRVTAHRICDRDGHRRVACWRAGVLRAWRCQRCGNEEQQP